MDLELILLDLFDKDYRTRRKYMTCNLLQNIFFREFARFFRGMSQFQDIEMFCFREIMLPLKYVIRTIAVSEDLNLLFSGD